MKRPAQNAPPRLAIKRLDAPYRWLVQSESDPDVWYGVDLLENNRVGQCDCDHFRFRLAAMAAESTQSWNGIRCKHLVIVREALLNALLLSMANNKYDDETKNIKNREKEDSGANRAGAQRSGQAAGVARAQATGKQVPASGSR